MSAKSEDPKWNFAFRDQPHGRCSECRWNLTPTHGAIHCGVPMTHLSDMVCMMKLQTQILLNAELRAQELEEDLNDGNDWKESDSL